jgi:uncharacterized glyoxalase superfamily protein PhnB
MLNQVEGAELHANGVVDCWDAYFWVSDADALFAEFKGKGAEVVCVPEDQPYEMRDFTVRDLDGHLLAFGHNTGGTA